MHSSRMDASRLVFVSVKNARPRRKVAVPIPEGYTWEKFCQQIETKLKIKAVGTVVLATSNERVTTLEELQDIDELYVEEAEIAPASPNGVGLDRANSGGKASTSSGLPNGTSHSPEPTSPSRPLQRLNSAVLELEEQGGLDGEQKYVKRSSGVRRSLQRVLPALFSPRPGLPVTTKDTSEEGRKDGRRVKKRKKSSIFALRNLLKTLFLLLFLLVLLYLYSRMVPRIS